MFFGIPYGAAEKSGMGKYGIHTQTGPLNDLRFLRTVWLSLGIDDPVVRSGENAKMLVTASCICEKFGMPRMQVVDLDQLCPVSGPVTRP